MENVHPKLETFQNPAIYYLMDNENDVIIPANLYIDKLRPK